MNPIIIKNKVMNNREQFAREFAELLNKYLIRKYKKTPSANFFANQFNVRAKGTTTITAETARKWIRGIAVPEIDRFIVLIDWLGFHPGELFGFENNADKVPEMSELIEILEKQLMGIKETINEYKKQNHITAL